MADPELLAYRERIRLTEKGELVGYRRLYRDCAEPTPMPADWPHHFLIRSEHVEVILGDGVPRTFQEIIERCRSCGVKVRAFSVAGSVIDLASPEGLLTLSDAVLAHGLPRSSILDARLRGQVYACGANPRIAPGARFAGPVLIGDGVSVEPDAVVIGPSVLCDGCVVQRGAVVDSSILGTETVVEADRLVDHSLVIRSSGEASGQRICVSGGVGPWLRRAWSPSQGAFMRWPRFSYAGTLKRVADVVFATLVLVLFAPIVPLIALAIRINSPGPVFFRDKRQGLHGRLFDCVKFRTMRVGAAEIQDKLRFVSEVDGPQFKMADDPRISTVGHFLRETYLDEIPQFFNVLCGQMSIVGPRPSPESENRLCPAWRDARLSVRPGITGLWQIHRTREPFKDFQEWIYYDTKYVQELSPQMDLWVCWRTFRKMLDNFIRQF
jgi:lipopolysaccharide/colanic/teichoic acid biosynthesis glycosyltransferase